MPTYEYECTSCGYNFEEFQGINEPPIKKCPQCGKKVKKIIGVGAGIIFKGSGFYETDYKKKDKPSTCSSEKTSVSCPASSGEKCSKASSDKDKPSCCPQKQSTDKQ